MQESRYLERFKRLAESGAIVLVGDTLLVEKLGVIESKTKSGIIIPTNKISTYKTTVADEVIEFGVVLMVGPGDVEDGEHLPTTTKPGDIIALPMNVQWYSQFGEMEGYEIGTIGRMRDAQVMMSFPDYEAAMEALNEKRSEVQSNDSQPSGSRADAV